MKQGEGSLHAQVHPLRLDQLLGHSSVRLVRDAQGGPHLMTRHHPHIDQEMLDEGILPSGGAPEKLEAPQVNRRPSPISLKRTAWVESFPRGEATLSPSEDRRLSGQGRRMREG